MFVTALTRLKPTYFLINLCAIVRLAYSARSSVIANSSLSLSVYYLFSTSYSSFAASTFVIVDKTLVGTGICLNSAIFAIVLDFRICGVFELDVFSIFLIAIDNS